MFMFNARPLYAAMIPLFATSHEGGNGGSSMTLLDMDSILGQSLDDTPDVPEFINDIPAGSYLLTITKAGVEKYKSKDEDTGLETERMRIRVVYSIQKTIELADPTDIPVPDGSLFSESFMVNENGMQYFKRQAKKTLGTDNIQGASVKEILAEMENDLTLQAKVKTKSTKADNGKEYKNVQVHIIGTVDDPDFVTATGS